MATAAFTTVEARVNQQLTNAIWADELQDNLNQLAGAHRNLLTNGGFEVWQRGAGPFTASLAYTADRWQLTAVSSTTVTKETTTVDGSAAALKVVVVGSTTTLTQKIENVAELRGKTIYLSFRTNQSVSHGVAAWIDSTSGTFGPQTGLDVSATTGGYVTLTAIYAVPANATEIDVNIQLWAAGTYYLDNAMLVIGPAPAPYRPLHPQEDLARCQRYYEVHGGLNPSMAVLGYDAAGAVNGNLLLFHVAKAVTPTMTKNGTWSVTNCNQPGSSVPSVDGYVLFATVTALGHYTFQCNSTDDNIVAESNP